MFKKTKFWEKALDPLNKKYTQYTEDVYLTTPMCGAEQHW